MPVVRGVFLPKAPFPAELIGGFCGTRAAPSPDGPQLKPKARWEQRMDLAL